jgi:hypothetical protein
MAKSVKSKGYNAREKRKVFEGKKSKTSSGLSKDHLTKSKSGKIVSAKKHSMGKKNPWAQKVAAYAHEHGTDLKTAMKALKGTSGKRSRKSSSRRKSGSRR